jgi:hypothetical protein
MDESAPCRDRATRVQRNRESFLAASGERSGPEAVAIATKIMDWAPEKLPLFWWGEGRNYGSCYRGVEHGGKRYYVFSMWTYGRIDLELKWLDRRVADKAWIVELTSSLNEIPGIQIGPEQLNKFPEFYPLVLRDAGALEKFFSAVERFVERITKTQRKQASGVTCDICNDLIG